ncbi:MAG: hypothetical protein WED15_05755 [Akkermansiaceae bacterium]
MSSHLNPSTQACISGIHFFVGAGSSHRISNQGDYDFPLGSSLLKSFKLNVTSAATSVLPSEQKSWAIENFNQYKSIDEFLGMATCFGYRDLVDLGRKFVDLEISRCEAKVEKYFKDHSKTLIVPWLESFLDFMTQDVDRHEDAYRRLKWVDDNNNASYPTVNFATLNYDRLIEISLKNYFTRKYPDAIEQITQDFETPGNLVQHHHGSLGSLQERPFGDVKENPSPTLKFLFEYPDESQHWPIMNAMSNARNHGVFLGFGFHQSIATRFDFNGTKPKIYISDFGNGLEKVSSSDFKDGVHDFIFRHGMEPPITTIGDKCCVELIGKLVKEFSKSRHTDQ